MIFKKTTPSDGFDKQNKHNITSLFPILCIVFSLIERIFRFSFNITSLFSTSSQSDDQTTPLIQQPLAKLRVIRIENYPTDI